MYFFHCEETRLLVSIFTYIDAMLLNLEVPVPQQTKLKFYFFLKFKISKISKIKFSQKNSKYQFS